MTREEAKTALIARFPRIWEQVVQFETLRPEGWLYRVLDRAEIYYGKDKVWKIAKPLVETYLPDLNNDPVPASREYFNKRNKMVKGKPTGKARGPRKLNTGAGAGFSILGR